MARKARVRYLCTYCEAKISEGTSFCGSCSHPTSWATHDEKVAWELRRYEQDRSKLIEAIPQTPTPVIPRVYTRRAAAAPRAPEPVRAAHVKAERPSKPVRTVERVSRPVRLPVTRVLPEVPLPDADDQALLFKIVRVLNQRIEELEQRVAQLEGSDSQAVSG